MELLYSGQLPSREIRKQRNQNVTGMKVGYRDRHAEYLNLIVIPIRPRSDGEILIRT